MSKLKTILDTARASAARAIEGLREITAIERELRAAHAEARASLDGILGQPVPVDEVVRNMRAWVDMRAQTLADDHFFGILSAFSPSYSDDRGELRLRRQFTSWDVAGDLRTDHLFILFPEQVKARLEAVIRSRPYTAGPAQEQRQQAHAAAVARKRAVEDEHAGLVDQAAQLDPPVHFDHLPEVAERRRLEQHARERWAALGADKRKAIVTARRDGVWVEVVGSRNVTPTEYRRTFEEMRERYNLPDEYLPIIDAEIAQASVAV